MLTNEAIRLAKLGLSLGAHPEVVQWALICEGFPEGKANTIIRWAFQLNMKEVEHGVETETSEPSV